MSKFKRRGYSPWPASKLAILFIFAILTIFSSSCPEPRRMVSASVGTPCRIVSIAPSVTETLFAVGAGERVVGVTVYCNYPPEAAGLPKVGQFAHFDFEKILSLRPDMIAASKDAPSETVVYEMSTYGISSVIVEASTINEAINSIVEIGEAVGNGSEARRIARDMRARVESIRTAALPVPKMKAIIVYDHEPLILGGPGTFADDMIRIAGGVNVAGDAYVKYPRYSIERLVLEGPDVIIEAAHGGGYGTANMKRIMAFWDKWPTIPAVKNGRIAIVDADILSRPGPRIVDGLDAMARVLHPELFPQKAASR